MGKEALYELIDKVADDEISIVYFLLSRIVRTEENEVELLPEEIEAIKEYEEAKARGESFCSFEELVGKTPEEYSKEHLVA